MAQHDDHDDLRAQLNFSAARDDRGQESAALRAYAPAAAHDDSAEESTALRAYAPAAARDDSGTEVEAMRSQTKAAEEENEEDAVQLFTVTNPSRSVSVSAFMGGSFQRVSLSAKLTNMSERQLADEILVLADLARQKGESGQHTFLFEAMQALGVDDGEAVSELLEDGIGLSSPKRAAAAQAEVFATRYAADHD
jgi:hypothetical protein